MMPETKAEQTSYSENLRCDKCGEFGAYEFDGASLCTDCYQGCGSCCPEFGADDLWGDR